MRNVFSARGQEKTGCYMKIVILLSSTELPMVAKGKGLFFP
jgi:hypothetical protein